MKHLISPSILSADFANLGRDIEMINNSQADWIHVDVMDGRFVPNISFGFPVIEAVKRYAKKPLDVHLMILEPEKYIDDFKKAGADHISVHIEASPHLHRTIQAIKSAGMKAGVAINPHTPIAALESIIRDLDLVIIMSVNPGFGGQKFIENTYQRIEQLKNMISEQQLNTLIEIDGGVNEKNAKDLLKAGADALVAGSSVFNAPDPEQMIKTLKNIDINTIQV